MPANSNRLYSFFCSKASYTRTWYARTITNGFVYLEKWS